MPGQLAFLSSCEFGVDQRIYVKRDDNFMKGPDLTNQITFFEMADKDICLLLTVTR